MKIDKAIVYLTLDPEKAKEKNLPVKLPLLIEDFVEVVERNEIPIEYVIRGLEAQYRVEKDEYWASYLVYFYYELFKLKLSESPDEALELLEKAKRVKYDHRYHFYKGLLYKRKGYLEEAEVELNRATEMSPDFYPAWFELGEVAMNRGDLDDALKYYQKAAQSNRSFLPAFLKISDVYAGKGLHDQARLILEKIVEADPNFSPALLRLGVMENVLQRFESAVRYFKKALDVDPDNWQLHYNLAYSLSRLGHHLEALQHLKKAYALNNEDFIANELMIQERNMGLFEESVDLARKLLGEESTFRKNALKTLYFSGDFKGVMENIDFSEKDAELLELLALSVFESGDFETFVDIASSCNESLLIESLRELLVKGDLVEGEDVSLEETVTSFETLKLPFPMKKRLDAFVRGFLDVEEYCEPRFVGTMTKYVKKFGCRFSALYRWLTKVLMVFYGCGEALAFGRILYRLYQRGVLNLGYDLDGFVDEVVEELKDLSWKVARSLVDMLERPRDAEEFAGVECRNFVDLTVGLLIFLEDEWNEAIMDKELEKVYREVKEWFK